MQVEDDTSPSRKGRKANIRVVSRGAQQQASAVITKSKSEPLRKISKSQRTRLAEENVSSDVTRPLLYIESAMHSSESSTI